MTTCQERLLAQLKENHSNKFTTQQAYKYIEIAGYKINNGKSSVRSVISTWVKQNICERITRGTYKFINIDITENELSDDKSNELSVDNPINDFHTLVTFYKGICGGNKLKPIGYAGEDIVVKMKCKRCNKQSNKKMKENQKSYDIECTNCKQKTQVKTSKSISPKNNILKNVTGGSYTATISTFHLNIDYICIRYDIINGIYTLKKYYYTKFENIKFDDIIKVGKNNETYNKCTLNLTIDDVLDIP
jgi:hypothetical protein